jgi:hypothetical protein
MAFSSLFAMLVRGSFAAIHAANTESGEAQVKQRLEAAQDGTPPYRRITVRARNGNEITASDPLS